MKVVRKTKPYIQQITCPTFIVQGSLDGIDPSNTAQLLFDQIASIEKYMYISKRGKHHICYSEDCEQWFKEVYHFLKYN